MHDEAVYDDIPDDLRLGDENESDPFSAIERRIEKASDVALEPAEPIPFDVEGILPACDQPALMFGPPASMKSWLAIALCDAMVRGVPFLGLATRRRPCALYVNLDAGPITFRNRVRAASAAPGFDIVSISSAEYSHEILRRLLEQYRGGFIAIDCLSSIYNPDAKSDPAFAMRAFVDGLRALFAAHDCGGVIIDHPHRPKEKGEAGDFFGSGQKEAAFRTMWVVSADAPDPTIATRGVRIGCRKLSEGAPFAPIAATISFGERVTIEGSSSSDSQPRTSLIEAKILEWGRAQTTAFSRRSVVERFRGHRTADVRDALESLITGGRIEPTGATRGGGDLFRVASVECVPISDPLGTHLDPLGSESVPASASASPISIGDALVGTHSGTHSKTALTASGIGTHPSDEFADMLDRPIGEIA